MSPLEFTTVLRQLPAGPFTLHVAERTTIEISHSDFAMLSPDTGILNVSDVNGSEHWIDTFAITRVAHRPSIRQPEA